MTDLFARRESFANRVSTYGTDYIKKNDPFTDMSASIERSSRAIGFTIGAGDTYPPPTRCTCTRGRVDERGAISSRGLVTQ